MGENTETAIFSLIIRLVVFVLYAYHLYRAFCKFADERAERSRRNLVLAFMLAFSLAALVGSSLVRVGVLPISWGLYFGYFVFGCLLITGIYVVVSWRLEDAVQKRQAKKMDVQEQTQDGEEMGKTR